MPHALLLSPDDQAVTAITGVLEEMSVTCERPLDGVSAAQKLNSQSFDLVLVDCENLPAAKLIFDVCRRGKHGNNPVPIAIVDGRAGLPTAFRLGAELILTKPVAKDQARTTIRTAVSRVRRDVPTNEGAPVQPANAVAHSAGMKEERAQAAAAAASTQLTSFADSAPAFVPTAIPTAAPATFSAPALTAKMRSAVDEVEGAPASPKLKPQTTSFSAASSSDLFEPSPTKAISVSSKPKLPLSDDPVLAELERAELEESVLPESQPAELQKESSGSAKGSSAQPVTESEAPASSSYQQGRQKPRRALVALLALALAGGGFYAAWMYQPGFRALAQPQIDRVLALAGRALPPTQTASPAKPSPQPAPAAVPVPAPAPPADPAKTESTVTGAATSSATGSATDSPTTSAASTPVQPSAPQDKALLPPAPGPTATTPVVSKPEASKTSINKPSEAKKTAAAAPSSDAPLPGENSAIILSSKGAEKRLAHSVPPKYPGAEGTVVLKEVVDEDGKVQGVRLVEGNAALATAAIEAVKQWRYRPYVRDGKAQPFQTVVIIDFQKP
ncbi:MAG: TonB family protein [Acidobacteriia bacterium]|nr:TonB family protein [Terriglobia bacterium]